jgi:predicted RNA polymerase sigma factor
VRLSILRDLTVKLGRNVKARADFKRAAALTRNVRKGELLLVRAAVCLRQSALQENRSTQKSRDGLSIF